MHHAVVMVVVLDIRLEDVVHEVERIDRLQRFIHVALRQLHDIRLRRVEQNAAPEARPPVHLHLDDELAPARLLAPHVDGRVLVDRGARHELRRQILYRLHLLAGVKGQQGVEKADDEVLVLAENLLECDVRLWIEVFCHVFVLASLSRGIVTPKKNRCSLAKTATKVNGERDETEGCTDNRNPF